jgi:uncharacterized repeat protein (TIGR03803 family)
MIKITVAITLAAAFFSFSLKADTNAYFSGDGGEFGIIDLNTGVFTLLGNSGQPLAGLAMANGTLYGAAYGGASNNGTLFSINPVNGSLSTIGSSSLDYSLIGSTTGGGIYGLDNNLNLYSINSSTGGATLIGSTGLGSLGTWSGLSVGSSTLYLTAGADLYTLNTTTGAAHLVGAMGGPQVGALVVQGGVLYGGEDLPNVEVDTINRSTGAATTGPALSGTSATFFGLAPAPAVPEPSVAGLLALGIGSFLILFRRKNSLKQSRY